MSYVTCRRKELRLNHRRGKYSAYLLASYLPTLPPHKALNPSYGQSVSRTSVFRRHARLLGVRDTWARTSLTNGCHMEPLLSFASHIPTSLLSLTPSVGGFSFKPHMCKAIVRVSVCPYKGVMNRLGSKACHEGTQLNLDFVCCYLVIVVCYSCLANHADLPTRT